MDTKEKVLARASRCLRSLKSHLASMEEFREKVKAGGTKEDLERLFEEVQQMEEAFLIDREESLLVEGK